MILRASKFFGFCYADEITEKEFFAKNFKMNLKGDIAEFSFEFMRGLDVVDVKKKLRDFSFFVLEDHYLVNKITKTLQEYSHVKKITLRVNGETPLAVKKLKITLKGILIQVA